MKQENTKSAEMSPYFFMTDKCIISIPEAMEESSKTIDMTYKELVNNKNLQEDLNIGSSVYAETNKGMSFTAFYLSSFRKNSEDSNLQEEYLLNNGLVRILILDAKIRSNIIKF